MPILTTPGEIEWTDQGGRVFNLSLLSDGHLEIYMNEGRDDDYDHPHDGITSIAIAPPDVPDLLIALQSWIEQLEK